MKMEPHGIQISIVQLDPNYVSAASGLAQTQLIILVIILVLQSGASTLNFNVSCQWR
jgi:hypothetical protein